MITKKDILTYFDSEAKAARDSYNNLLSLPQEERVRKRKCIAGIHVNSDYCERDEEFNVKLKLSFDKNISDFKEGDYILLHEEGQAGFQCTLTDFIDDNTIIASVYQYDYPGDLKELAKKELVADKAIVDLRGPVYSNYYTGLSEDHDFWQSHIVNARPEPEYERYSECKAELEETVSSFKLSLTEKQKEAIVNSMAANNIYLIQGPPGTGKSFVLALIMMEEAFFFNRKIAIVGPNHLAINNAMEKLIGLYKTAFHITVKIGQYFNAPRSYYDIDGEQKSITNINRINVECVNGLNQPMIYGLTPHALYTSRARGLKFDTLFIDEAGQETIPLAMMAMNCAKKVILAGDHKQLPPIITSDEISEDLEDSIFKRLLRNGNYTMLDKSFRMHGPICDFVSSLFYEGKLAPFDPSPGDRIICPDKLISFDYPIVICNVNDDGQQFSEMEAFKIEDICSKYLSAGLPVTEIGIISPFRAQVAEIRRTFRKSHIISDNAKTNIVVDTIDKMQGQEREVIIVSMAAGDFSYMIEMGDFLYNPNKLNVAFSRAKSKLIIVGNVQQLKTIGESNYSIVDSILNYPKVLYQ